ILSFIHYQRKKVEMFSCRYCSLRTTSRGALTNHLKTHKQNFIICSRCRWIFDDEVSYAAHFYDHPHRRTADEIPPPSSEEHVVHAAVISATEEGMEIFRQPTLNYIEEQEEEEEQQTQAFNNRPKALECSKYLTFQCQWKKIVEPNLIIEELQKNLLNN